jgi:hypothetical protein
MTATSGAGPAMTTSDVHRPVRIGAAKGESG